MVKKEIQQKSADEHWLSQMVANKTDQQLVTMYGEVCIFRKTGVIPKECQTLRDLAREIQAVTKADNIQLRMAEDALLYEMSRRYYNSLYIEEKFDFPIEDDIAEEVSKMTNEVKKSYGFRTEEAIETAVRWAEAEGRAEEKKENQAVLAWVLEKFGIDKVVEFIRNPDEQESYMSQFRSSPKYSHFMGI